MRPHGETPGVFLGPHTTIWGVLAAYPFLAEYLARYRPDLRSLRASAEGGRWSRVTRLSDVAERIDVPWRRLARDLQDEVERVTGHAPPTLASLGAVPADDRRVAELQDIAARLEEGGSLPQLAARYATATEGLGDLERAALDRALVAEAREARAVAGGGVRDAAGPPAVTVAAPASGHPLDSLRREALQVRRVRDGLSAELERLGGSSSRRSWREAAPEVARLVARLSQVERRFRRQHQAWFPALAVHGVKGPEAVLGDRQTEALEWLRRLRLAVAHDDPGPVVENGSRVLELIDDLLSIDELILAPLAERHLSAADWAAVRQLEDGAGWALLPPPPPWPAA
ncbi:MAG: hypothetical protein WC709_10855 [Thermoleophilia bacterium]